MLGDIIQPTHLLFILVIALLVLGPKRLPEVGRSLGRGIRDFRDAVTNHTAEARELRDMVYAEDSLAGSPTATEHPVATSTPTAAALATSAPSTAAIAMSGTVPSPGGPAPNAPSITTDQPSGEPIYSD